MRSLMRPSSRAAPALSSFVMMNHGPSPASPSVSTGGCRKSQASGSLENGLGFGIQVVAFGLVLVFMFYVFSENLTVRRILSFASRIEHLGLGFGV